MPVPVSVTDDRDEIAAAGGLCAQCRDRSDLPHGDLQTAFAIHGVASVDGEIDQGGLELADIGDGEGVEIADLDLDLNAAADKRAHELGDVFDLGADVEHLRLQRLAAGKGKQLRGQFGGPLHRVRDRIDIAAAALLGQLAAAQEIGRRTDDGQEVVEVVRDAAGQLADGLHLLGLAQRFLALAAFGDVDGFRHGAGHRAMAIVERPHREIEIAVADRQMQHHVEANLFALQHPVEGVVHGLGHAWCRGKPRRFPEQGADHPAAVGVDPRQCRLVGVDQVAFAVEQRLILMAGLEDGAHLRFVGFELRGAVADAPLQRSRSALVARSPPPSPP